MTVRAFETAVPLLALALVVLAPGRVAHAEKVSSFNARIEIGRDASVTVHERIDYDFEGAWRAHVYRDIPTVVDAPGADMRLRVEILGVADEAGRPIAYHAADLGRFVRVRMGDPSNAVTGQLTYVLSYRATGALRFFEEHDELYWNVTGYDWLVPIDAAGASISVPSAASADIRRMCYTGYFGSTESDCRAALEAGRSTFTATGLASGEGLTVVVGFPTGLVQRPGVIERVRHALFELPAWCLAPLALILLLFARWLRLSRDPSAPVFDPAQAVPSGLAPGDAGAIWDERVDLDDLVATLLDLAARGHVTVEEQRSPRRIFFGDTDYELTRERGIPDPLTRFELLFLDTVFEMSDTVRVSSLRDSFYRELPRLRNALYERVTVGLHGFSGSPEVVRGRYGLAGWAIGLIGLLLLLAETIPAGLSWGLLSSAAVLGAAGRFMPLRTAQGVKIRARLKALRHGIAALADNPEAFGEPSDGSDFDRLLPFAIVLGVADDWVEIHRGTPLPAPEWFISPSALGLGDSVAGIGRFVRTFGAAIRSRPSASGGAGAGLSSGRPSRTDPSW